MPPLPPRLPAGSGLTEGDGQDPRYSQVGWAWIDIARFRCAHLLNLAISSI